MKSSAVVWLKNFVVMYWEIAHLLNMFLTIVPFWPCWYCHCSFHQMIHCTTNLISSSEIFFEMWSKATIIMYDIFFRVIWHNCAFALSGNMFCSAPPDCYTNWLSNCALQRVIYTKYLSKPCIIYIKCSIGLINYESA